MAHHGDKPLLTPEQEEMLKGFENNGSFDQVMKALETTNAYEPIETESSRITRMLRQAQQEGLGATNQFPQGKIAPQDKGEIKIAVIADTNKQKVILDFGERPIVWIGFTPGQAREIAQSLLHAARKAEEKSPDQDE